MGTSRSARVAGGGERRGRHDGADRVLPRPPYSGATYYVYERAGQTICTKLAVCNKFDQCETSYVPGAFRAPEDTATGEPYGTTPAVPIAPASLAKHVCLTRFGLVQR
ncbi:hypothetical protein [Methylorubrum sp. GM97]|uniref:hypothetical protein n=1 Tax=Methylorubrum sp. GM97 TaxID=2938232 RepID=UPI0021881561|nr:hypothetical protein [Methylorubrum sp. GM97]BDL40517.1 hypothetical protein MSPGM_31070 [Methylorubrum sp. GM97]